MAEVPDFQSMMLPILKRAAKGEINTKAAVETIANDFQLGPDDLAKLLSSGTATVASNRASWAMIYMERAGLLRRERRGVYLRRIPNARNALVSMSSYSKYLP
jgi:restriction system protein